MCYGAQVLVLTICTPLHVKGCNNRQSPRRVRCEAEVTACALDALAFAHAALAVPRMGKPDHFLLLWAIDINETWPAAIGMFRGKAERTVVFACLLCCTSGLWGSCSSCCDCFSSCCVYPCFCRGGSRGTPFASCRRNPRCLQFGDTGLERRQARRHVSHGERGRVGESGKEVGSEEEGRKRKNESFWFPSSATRAAKSKQPQTPAPVQYPAVTVVACRRGGRGGGRDVGMKEGEGCVWWCEAVVRFW